MEYTVVLHFLTTRDRKINVAEIFVNDSLFIYENGFFQIERREANVIIVKGSHYSLTSHFKGTFYVLNIRKINRED